MDESLFTGIPLAINLLVKSAPNWLPLINDVLISPARDALIGKVADKAFDKGFEGGRNWLGRDEKEQMSHLQLALQNSAERYLALFQTKEERLQYSEVISLLSTSNADALRREALRLFSLNDEPDLKQLNIIYNQLYSHVQSMHSKEIDAIPYLS